MTFSTPAAVARQTTAAPRKVYLNIKVDVLHTPAPVLMTADLQ